MPGRRYSIKPFIQRHLVRPLKGARDNQQNPSIASRRARGAQPQCLADGALWKHIRANLGRVLLGFVIGAGLALVFAAWVGLSREAKAYLEPTFAGLHSIPSLAWMFRVAAELIAATKGLG